jgi:hypothetical protein
VQLTFNGLHGVISQKIEILVLSAVCGLVLREEKACIYYTLCTSLLLLLFLREEIGNRKAVP